MTLAHLSHARLDLRPAQELLLDHQIAQGPDPFLIVSGAVVGLFAIIFDHAPQPIDGEGAVTGAGEQALHGIGALLPKGQIVLAAIDGPKGEAAHVVGGAPAATFPGLGLPLGSPTLGSLSCLGRGGWGAFGHGLDPVLWRLCLAPMMPAVAGDGQCRLDQAGGWRVRAHAPQTLMALPSSLRPCRTAGPVARAPAPLTALLRAATGVGSAGRSGPWLGS